MCSTPRLFARQQFLAIRLLHRHLHKLHGDGRGNGRHGELISWVIVESREGLRNVRAIAAVKGIGVLWLGAGTLREVFSTPDAGGRAVVDEVACSGTRATH